MTQGWRQSWPGPFRTAPMRAQSLLALAVLAVVPTSGCAMVRGSGVRLSEARPLAEFSEIEVSGGVELEVKKGPASLTIEGDDNIVPLYTTEVVSGRLSIYRKAPGSISPSRRLKVNVTVPSLRRLEASGGVEARLDGVAEPHFTAALSGGVELDARSLELDVLELEASGGVTLKLAGHARAARFDLSGGVGLDGRELEAGQVELEASGGCQLELTAKEAITGETSGGVQLRVFGNPPRSRVHTSGGADVDYVDS